MSTCSSTIRWSPRGASRFCGTPFDQTMRKASAVGREPEPEVGDLVVDFAELIGRAAPQLDRGTVAEPVVLAVALFESAQADGQPVIAVAAPVLEAREPGGPDRHEVEIAVAVEIGAGEGGARPRRPPVTGRSSKRGAASGPRRPRTTTPPGPASARSRRPSLSASKASTASTAPCRQSGDRPGREGASPSLWRRRSPPGPASDQVGTPVGIEIGARHVEQWPECGEPRGPRAIGEASLAEIVEPEEARRRSTATRSGSPSRSRSLVNRRRTPPSARRGSTCAPTATRASGAAERQQLAGRRTGTGERQIEVSFEVEVEHRERAAAQRELAGGGRPGGETRGPGAEAERHRRARGDEVDPAVLVEVGRLQRDEPGRPAENPRLEAAGGESDLEATGLEGDDPATSRTRSGRWSPSRSLARTVRAPAGGAPPAGPEAATLAPATKVTGSAAPNSRAGGSSDEALDRDTQDAARELTDPLLKERTRPQQVRQLLHRHPRARQIARLERRGQPASASAALVRGIPQKLANAQRRGRGAARSASATARLPAPSSTTRLSGRRRVRRASAVSMAASPASVPKRLAVAKEGELQVGTVGGTRGCGTEALEAAFEVSGGDRELGLDGDEIGAAGGEPEGAQERRPRLVEPGLAQAAIAWLACGKGSPGSLLASSAKVASAAAFCSFSSSASPF